MRLWIALGESHHYLSHRHRCTAVQISVSLFKVTTCVNPVLRFQMWLPMTAALAGLEVSESAASAAE